MKKFLVVVFSVFVVITLTQCKSKSNKSRIVNDSRTAQAEKKEDVEKVVIDTEYQYAKGPYRIKDFSINGDILSITISYKNACNDDDFNLYSSGMFMKSMPPQVNVFLDLKRSTGTCEENAEKTLKFDISALKYQGGNKVVVNINSHENKVDYNY